jgi:hypothetical protein
MTLRRNKNICERGKKQNKTNQKKPKNAPNESK